MSSKEVWLFGSWKLALVLVDGFFSISIFVDDENQETLFLYVASDLRAA